MAQTTSPSGNGKIAFSVFKYDLQEHHDLSGISVMNLTALVGRN